MFNKLDRLITEFNWNLKYKDQLKEFKDIHKGKSCFIIGNGPSLNKMDLSKLTSHYTFGLNKIYMMFDKVDLNLSYLVSVQQHVIEQSKEEFEKFTFPMFLSYRKSKVHNFKNKNIKYILTGNPKTTSFQTDITKKVLEGATVTYVAMQIAYYMGFEKVFLIGVDHNFQFEGKPLEIKTMQGSDPNHFDPNYFKGQQWGLPDLETSERYYNIAKETYEKAGREIIDATVDGKLQVYKKISYDQALAEASVK